MRFATTLQQGRPELGVVDGAHWIALGTDLRTGSGRVAAQLGGPAPSWAISPA